MWGFFPIYFLTICGRLARWRSRPTASCGRFISSPVLITVIRRWGTLRDLTWSSLYGRRYRFRGRADRVQLGHLYLRRELRRRDRDVARLLHQPVAVSAAGRVRVPRSDCSTAQWVAIGIGATAVAVITVDYGHLPWIALILAGSFGWYGLVKKRLALPPAEGLQMEATTLLVPALGYLGWLMVTGSVDLHQCLCRDIPCCSCCPES